MKNFLSAFLFVAAMLALPSEKIFPQFLNSSDTEFKTLNLISKTDSVSDRKSSSRTFKMKKQPWKAVLLSGVLPGAGQFYNESYWKIPVIAGLGGYFVYELIRNNNQYLDYKSQYANSQTQQNPSGDPQLLSLRDFYRDQRDNFIIYSSILYVIQLVDAYVDAELYDFDVSDKVKVAVMKNNSLLKLSIEY